MKGDDYQLSVCGEFLNSELEEKYQQLNWPRVSHQLRWVTMIEGVAYTSALFVNYMTFGVSTAFQLMTTFRFIEAVILMAAFFSCYASRYNFRARALIFTSQIFITISEITEYYLYLERQGSFQDIGTPFILVAILLFYLVMPNRASLTVSASIFAGSVFVLFHWLGPVFDMQETMFILFSAIAVNGLGFGVMVSWNRLGRQEYIHQALLEEEIIERKRAQLEAQLAREEAERASQAKSRFLAIVSHEIRTPLNGVLGGAQLLKDTPLSEKQTDIVTMINRSGSQLTGLIGDVLDLARIEADEIALDITDFHIESLVDDVKQVLQFQISEPENVQLRVAVDEDVPKGLSGDVARLRQILVNLGSNAIKFTQQGEVLIRVATVERGQHRPDTATLRFSVIDSGRGIAGEDQEIIFQPFLQLDDSKSREDGGIGLGLSICKRLVEAMNGSISVVSVESGGSEFFFELELGLGQEAEYPAESLSIGESPKCLILLVDDTPANLMVAKGLLESLGHTVKCADSGEQAISMHLQDHFDLILLDLHLPELDGIAVTQRIRDLPSEEKSRTPIVAITADVVTETLKACQEAGMQGFLTKPLDKEVLARAVIDCSHGVAVWHDDQSEPAIPVVSEKKMLLDEGYLGELQADLGPEMFPPALESCVQSLQACSHEIREAEKLDDGHLLKEVLHRLKGISGSYGLIHLYDQSMRLHAQLQQSAQTDASLIANDETRITDVIEETIGCIERVELLD